MTDFSSLVPLDGGWSGETFLASAGEERSVVRIFADPRHGPHAAEVQEAVLRLVRGLVPVPGVEDVRRAEPALDRPGILVTGLLQGTRGDLLLPRLDDVAAAALGERLGRIAATLAGMPFLTAGLFADADLTVQPFAADVEEWVEQHVDALGWSTADLDGLRGVAAVAAERLGTVGRTSLVHGDLNPKNVLVDDTGEVAGVLDWEYAHAGSPYADLGNLLRFDRGPAYADGVLRGWTTLRGGDPAQALDLARSADLVALVDLAARRTANPVAARAHERLLAVARTGDLHAG